MLLRVLHLYVTVPATDGLPTPVRMKPLPVVLEAPPDSFAWGKGAHRMAVPTSMAVPKKLERAWWFSSEESAAIWCSAKAFRAEAPTGGASSS